MSLNKKRFEELMEELTVDTDTMNEIAADFRYDLRKGLQNPDLSSLRMLKSYVALPDGSETGTYLAVDFGGTNVRVSKVTLKGNGEFSIDGKVAKPLKVDGIYDFIGPDSTAEQMFDFIAGLVDEVVGEDHETPYLLGHTFSFPSEQTDLNNAKLIIWTKEFATKGVEGHVVNDLLQEALVRQGLTNVHPVAVINDTVAVLLAAAYQQSDTYIGSIYATGQNTCYFEPFTDRADPGMILNLESGGFMKLVPSPLDVKLDDASEKPGEQRLEKMTSGRYMGELFNLALGELFGEEDKCAYGFTSVDMSAILEDETPDLAKTAALVESKTGHTLTQEECGLVQKLAKQFVVRSARLVASTYVGIIWQLSGREPIAKQHIAVDGSVYEKMPYVKENLMRDLSELLKEDTDKVDTFLQNGGSCLGAAIAAAMSEKN